MKSVKWGILSTGNIAHNFAKTIAEMGEDTKITAVASRNLATAQAFADQYQIPTAYGSYQDLAQDPDVDIVYIGTPHSHHFENMKLLLSHGKHILCEKSFTTNATQAAEIFALAKEKNLFVMEAFWTKLIPIYRWVEEIIAKGTIGEIRLVTAQYGYITGEDRAKRKFDPALAGGALLDIGVYNLGFVAMILGYHPEKIFSTVSLNDQGTDDYSAILLQYKNGVMAQLTTAIQTEIPLLGCIYGSKGYIKIPDYKNPTKIEVILNDGTTLTQEQSYQSTGFEFEIREAVHCVANGLQQSQIMTPDQSVAIMAIMDEIRQQWGMIFPFEKA